MAEPLPVARAAACPRVGQQNFEEPLLVPQNVELVNVMPQERSLEPILGRSWHTTFLSDW